MNFILLPIQLSSFTGKLQNNQVALNWAIAQSSNADHFIIERSSSGQTFEVLAQVQASAGVTNSNATIQYNYTDAAALSTTAYYRLKMVDEKGAVSYSDIVTIKNGAAGEMKIYPTVLQQQTTLNIQAGEAVQQATVTVTDMQGRTLQQNNLAQLAAGQKASISLRPNLAKGVYVVQVRDNSKVLLNKTIIVQ